MTDTEGFGSFSGGGSVLRLLMCSLPQTSFTVEVVGVGKMGRGEIKGTVPLLQVIVRPRCLPSRSVLWHALPPMFSAEAVKCRWKTSVLKWMLLTPSF